MRYFAFISYNGFNYKGFQKQVNGFTVQSVVEYSLEKIFKSKIKIVISSRTDSGVHSYNNCFHFDIPFKINCDCIKESLNTILPWDISILEIKEVIENAHSRFSAIKRRYRYVITNKNDPFEIGYYYNRFESLDVDKMNHVAKYLLGETSFKSFSKINKNEKHDYKCIIYDSFCSKSNGKIFFEIEGNRFTHSLVRCLMFNILQIGIGKFTFDEFKNRLISTDMKLKKGIAPAIGLILVKVYYDDKIWL